jgi:dihydrofolate reductase
MRKLKLQVQMTLDGFIAGPNGEMDWVTTNWDDEIKKYIKKLTEPIDSIALGRKLAQGFIPHWASMPAEEDPWGVDKMNSATKVVFTKTLGKAEWPNTILAKGNLADEMVRLKKQDGKDIIVYGGATLVSGLIKEKLIDEFYLFINPVAIGKGMAIFNGLDSKQELILKQSKSFDCGIVVHHYNLKT